MTAPSAAQLLREALEHHRAGRLAEAEAIYRCVLADDPNQPDALQLLGYLAHQCGKHEAAVELISRAIRMRPGEAPYHNNLGMALRALRRDANAEANFREAVRLDPELPDARMNLAGMLAEQGRSAEAIEHYGVVDTADAHAARAVLLHGLRRTDGEAAAWRRVTDLRPDDADAFSNLAQALAALGRRQADDAVRCGERAVQLRPDFAEGWCNLGIALHAAGRHDEAVAVFGRSIALNDKLATTHTNLGDAFLASGQPEEAIACYRRALELNPDEHEARDNLLLTLHYRRRNPSEMFDEHRRLARPRSISPPLGFSMSRDPDRRLRVGYVSPDFRRHSVAAFVEPILAGHDRERFDVICYANVAREDEVTQRLRALPVTWRSIVGVGDDRAAQLVRSDAIDILIDLAGHTGDNRLGIFAHRAAPVQATYLGYPDTSGMDGAMDYRLTDGIADPSGNSDRFHTERVVRLGGGAWCYRPPADAPEPAVTPPNGPIVFGCFNALPKVSPELIVAWAAILAGIPGSRLLLKAAALGIESVRQRVGRDLAAAGIYPGRIDLLGRIGDPREHLRQYHRVTVALDTFPYNGTTTTCEALWMGVPVVTWAGDTHASRVGASLLHRIGMDEYVAHSADDYVSAAVRSAQTPLARGPQLRQRMERSPLRDERAFVASFESTLREMWRTSCAAAVK
jgi:protein O-GlcNAc transferase